MDFKKADYLSGVSNKHFIADLMPRYPIYVPTLPESAQEVIGVLHEESEKSTDVLLEEGFAFRGYVDIFDAGPTLEARTENLTTISQQRMGKALIQPNPLKGELHLISAGHLEDFRVTVAPAEPQAAGLAIDKKTQEQLSISSGSRIQWVAL